MAEGDGGQSTSGGRYTIAPDLLGQEAGNSGVTGGLTAYLRCMFEGEGLRVIGEAPGVVAETGNRIEAVEGHDRRDFGSGKGEAAAGISQVW